MTNSFISSCDYCRGITIETLARPKGYQHCEPARGRDVNAPDYCFLCAVMRLKTVGSVRVGAGTLKLRSDHPDLLRPRPHLEITIDGSNFQPFYRMIPLYTKEGDPAQELGVPLLLELMSTSSTRAFDIARHWVKCCDQDHDCITRGPWLNKAIDPPVRLVDLAQIGGTSDVRIVEIARGGPWPKYATLSYCWGSEQNLDYVTTESSLVSRIKRLRYDLLPLTIQNTVDICRAIGIRYLWVDALCIIQDSEDDWKTEAAKMASIYARSYITIAADSGRTANDGCFAIRSPVIVEIPSTLSDGRNSVLYLPFGDFFGSLPREVRPVWNLWKEPLCQRGWTLQERILSPRVLHYTKQGIYWECRSGFKHEELEYVSTPYSPGLVRHLNLDGTNDRILAIWYLDLIRNDYSPRKLSVATDRLLAISGLASLVHDKLRSRYLAGHWLDGLEWSLLWLRTSSNSHLSLRPSTYVAPSWSWATVDDSVHWRLSIRYPDTPPRFSIEAASTTLAGIDPFGRVNSGSLKVTGKLLRGRLEIRNDVACVTDNDRHPIGIASLDYWETPGPVSLLLLFTPPDGTRFYMLLSVIGLTQGEYRRIGLLVISNFVDDENHRQTFTVV
jgi:hypothetical protein